MSIFFTLTALFDCQLGERREAGGGGGGGKEGWVGGVTESDRGYPESSHLYELRLYNHNSACVCICV